jgi:hypothetical protein
MSYNPYNQGPGAEAGYGYGQGVSSSPDRAGLTRVGRLILRADMMRPQS